MRWPRSHHDDSDSLCPALAEHKTGIGRDVLGALDESEADAGPVAGPQPLAVHRDDPGGLADDLTMNDRLKVGESEE